MVRNTSMIEVNNGWYWKFKNNKKRLVYFDQKSVPEKDAFIANKISKVGKGFGFVRFLGVKNDEQIAQYDVHVQELGRGLLILMIRHFKILTQTPTWIANDMSKDQDKISHSNAYNVVCKEETPEIQTGRMEKSNSSNWRRPPASSDGFEDCIKKADEVFNTWMAFEGNTRDLGSFGEETDKITDLHQIHEEVLFTKRGDGVAGIKRRRRDLSSDGVRTWPT
ncbi:hypothetical protein Tco_0661214 [Tanacetum coccineum]